MAIGGKSLRIRTVNTLAWMRGTGTLRPRDLRDARRKVPAQWEFVDEMPFASGGGLCTPRRVASAVRAESRVFFAAARERGL